jgi:hypothetical protein
VENAEDEGEGEGEGEEEEQWLTVETVEAGGELLSTFHVNSGECKRRRRKRRGRGRAVADGVVHSFVSVLLLPRLCLPVLFLFLFFRASVYCVYKHSLQLSTAKQLEVAFGCLAV